ncbi:MAG: sugar-transfer associated ATP-grasp domain-containing protein [bacterium]
MLDFLKKSSNILGINARNLSYIRPSNPQSSVQLADNKLKTKKILKRAGAPVASTFGIIRSHKDLASFNWNKLPDSFALKPNRGIGGEGILIVYGRKKNNNWVKADKSEVSIKDLQNHIRNILDGNFSLFNIPDIAFFEGRIKILKLFKPYSYRGIPDIRIIVYNGVPVMAMLRIPTRESGGKANLQQGGIGAGIDMASGVTTTSILGKKRIVEYVPGTRLLLSGIKIPYWTEILKLSVKAQKVSNLGYLGADIAIDREKGPVFFELNARPGLSIQIANLTSLKDRLERIKGLEIKTIKRGVRIAQDLFGGEIEEEVEDTTGKNVIGINEEVEIIDKQGISHKILAKIDTGAFRTTICQTIAEQFGIDKIVDYKKVRSALGTEKRSIIEFSFVLDKYPVSTQAFIADREKLKYDMIIGRRDLKRFLVDPDKKIFMTDETKQKHELRSLKKRLRKKLKLKKSIYKILNT